MIFTCMGKREKYGLEGISWGMWVWWWVCHNATEMLCLLTKWHSAFCSIFFPSRENHCTFGLFCAGNSWRKRLFVSFRMLLNMILGAFWPHVLLQMDFVRCLRGPLSMVCRRQFLMPMSGWLPGCKRLQPQSQTFASEVANICIWARNLMKSRSNSLKING